MTGSRIITVRCPQCGHVFEVDPDKVGREQIVHRGEHHEVHIRVQCPNDHTYFIIPVPAPDNPPPGGPT